jgi:hypothetical protein
MNLNYNSFAALFCYLIAFALLPFAVHAKIVMLDMIIPQGGVAYEADGGFITPDMIVAVPLSADQNLSNMLDNNQNTYYQPAAGSNGTTIGSDVLLDFVFHRFLIMLQFKA